MSITIGQYRFEGPFASTTSLQNRSGVYAILKHTGGTNYSVIDVGESATVKTRVENHDRKPCWQRNNYTHYAVYYAGESERMRIESELRRQYNPPCGDK